MHQRVRPRADGEPVGLQRPQVLGRDVLVVERDDLAAGGDRPEGRQVAVVADDVVGDHLRGRDALGLGEQPQRQRQGGGRFRHHPGQLPAPDDREPWGVPRLVLRLW